MANRPDGPEAEGLLCEERLGPVFADKRRDLHVPLAVSAALTLLLAVWVCVWRGDPVLTAAGKALAFAGVVAVKAGVALVLAIFAAAKLDLYLGRVAPTALKLWALLMLGDVVFLMLLDAIPPEWLRGSGRRRYEIALPILTALVAVGLLAKYLFEMAFVEAQSLILGLLLPTFVIAVGVEILTQGWVPSPFGRLFRGWMPW